MNKKTKMPKRLLSVLLALAMVFCLLPISALAEGTPLPVNATYYDAYASGMQKLPELQEQYPVELDDATPGQEYTLKLPANTEYTIGETTYTLERVKLIAGGPEGTSSHEWTIPLDEEESMTMYIPAGDIRRVAASYYWKVSGDEPTDPEEPGGRPGIVTNVINSLTRTVAQKEKGLPYKTQYGMDIYRVESKNDLTLTYSADMDMTKLGSSFFGDNSWETLQKHWTEIKDATWVDLHFQFDEEVTITDDALANAKLESDMFSEKFNEDGSNQWWTITGKELILHCKWDSDKAKASMEANGKLNPMIKLTGVKVALPDDWGDKDTIVIRNHGYVDGKVWARLEGATNDEWADIDGGEKDDEFVLTTSDKVSLPGLEKKIIEDGEEKDNTSVNVKNDTVNFQLKSNVPEDLKELIEYTGNGTHDKVDVVGTIPEGEEYTLTFHDKMNSAFVVPEYFLVYLGDDMLDQTKLLELDKDYQVNFDPKDCTFEIQLDLVKLYNEGIIKDEDLGKTSITVSYNTKLKDTVTNGTFENEAWVTAGEWETSHDVVTVDTYQIAVKKYETNHPNEEKFFLDGAVFGLYKDEACTEQIAKKTTGEVKKGFVYFSGLEAGTYYLKELQAPEGYVCSSEVVKIVVSEESDGENIVHASFANSLIPHTGGMGTTIFSIVGGVLIAMAGTVFVISRRRRRA